MTGFALLGCGRIGTLHARNIAAHPRAELVACYDVAGEAAASVAGAFGARAAGSVDEALQHPGVRAVLIASSTDTHADLIVRAARAGKAVLCEKPIALTMARVEGCWREIAPLRPLVAIGFNRRFDPSFRALRDRLRSGEIGALEQLVITSRDPAPPPARYVATSGGLFRDMTIHDFDMARYLAGDIVQVQAMGANLIDPAIRAAGDIDAAMLVLHAASGAPVHINNSRRCAYGYDQRVEAFGETGMLQAGNRHPTTVEAWGAAPGTPVPGLPCWTFSSSDTARRTKPSWTTSSAAWSGVRRRSPASRTAARRCAWPTPRRRAWRRARPCASPPPAKRPKHPPRRHRRERPHPPPHRGASGGALPRRAAHRLG